MKNLLLSLILLVIFNVNSKAQIGCTKDEIQQADSLFADCEQFQNCIYTEIPDNTGNNIVIFNFEDNYCTSITIYANRESDISVKLIQIFSKCNNENWFTSIHYTEDSNLQIYKIEKE